MGGVGLAVAAYACSLHYGIKTWSVFVTLILNLWEPPYFFRAMFKKKIFLWFFPTMVFWDLIKLLIIMLVSSSSVHSGLLSFSEGLVACLLFSCYMRREKTDEKLCMQSIFACTFTAQVSSEWALNCHLREFVNSHVQELKHSLVPHILLHHGLVVNSAQSAAGPANFSCYLLCIS